MPLQEILHFGISFPPDSRRSIPVPTRLSSFVLAFFLGILARDLRAIESGPAYSRDVRPILSRKCFACHGPDEGTREANLRLDDPLSAFAKLDSETHAIVPGDADASELVRRIEHHDEDGRMPPPEHGGRLSTQEIQTLRDWIAAGAKYDPHWAYLIPSKSALPKLDDAHRDWPRQPLDAFMLAEMRKRQLVPSEEADRRSLCRRVYLDLIGIPPTREQLHKFLSNEAPDAYESLVDQLLSSPSFGEHWGRQWLDLARYADSAGYADDPLRTIWGYRDWVIRAINQNLPFDQFTIQQLAGDLFPNASWDQRVATAFHRNTMTNNEGGTIDEEFRNVAVVDRVNTTLSVWMGTTMACCQCHNHKYDPISQAEYFQLFAYFNNTVDSDRTDESPVQPVYAGTALERYLELEHQLRTLRAGAQSSGSTDELSQVATLPPKIAAEVARMEGELASLPQETSVPVFVEKQTDRRVTRLQRRGNYLDLGETVAAGLPVALNPLQIPAPPDRLGFAKWLVSRENPLTARVIVNRYWEAIFGRGLVVTSEDFGSQGELPSHPELLDWLAVDLQEHGWDIKRLLRQLVVSATYRQSSRITPETLRLDPENIWLARGPRVRHSAEMIRDQALLASGLLSPIMYGPPVQPPQPNLGLSAAFGSSTDWKTSTGENRYRRAIYTSWRRSSPYPAMATFDAPNREVCTIRRSRTNTPLQALVTLNDPAFVEAAQALACCVLESQTNIESAISEGFERILARPPSQDELNAILRLHAESLAHFSEDAAAADRLIMESRGKLPGTTSSQELAAMTTIMNVLLNIDEVFLKR